MTPTTTDWVMQGLELACLLAAPVVGAGLLSALFSSVLQAWTGWHDSALSQIPRLVAVVVAWSIAAPWIAGSMGEFARTVWTS